jgi:amino acid transporter/roadblock/LC7 domain-containing protein
MTIAESPSPDVGAAPAAYPNAGETGRLRGGRLRFFRTIAESVGVQAPTAGVLITAAILASISGGGTALVQTIAAAAMGFVAYAFIIFTRGFNSAGSVYGFTGAVAGPRFGFLSAWTLMFVYVSFTGACYALVADEARPAFGAVGLHLAWPVYAIIAFVLVLTLACLDIKFSATVILVLESASMLLVITACGIILAKGGYHGHAFSSAPFRPDGVALSVLGLGVVLSFSTFSGFEAASTLGEESQQPRRLIPLAIAVSLAVVAVFEIGVAAVVTNAYPGIKQLAVAPVPLVTVTDKFVAGWLGELINFGAVVSAFGAALACAIGASRILFTLGRDAGPGTLHRTSRRTGAPVGALIWVGAGSLLTLLVVIKEPLATRAVTIGLTYGADLIIAAYILVVAAAIIFTIRRRMSPANTVILLVGLAVLGYVVKATFVPIPPAPYDWDALAAGITLAAGIALPFVYRPLWHGIQHSPLLRVGADALLGTRTGTVSLTLREGITPFRAMPARLAHAMLGYRAEERSERSIRVVSEFDELVSLDGILMAGRFDPDWRIAEYKGAWLLVPNQQALQMMQWFCAAVSAMLSSMAFAVDSVGLGGDLESPSWLPLKSWTFSGGDYSIAVNGHRFVIAETAKIKSLDELRHLLRDQTP